jgi:protein kinase C substrate 80K-H
VYIRASRVNDGLCESECCDGSDEAPGICPNVCHVVGEEVRRAQEADRKLRHTGGKIRSTYIKFAQKEKAKLEASIALLTVQVEQRQADEARAKGMYSLVRS